MRVAKQKTLKIKKAKKNLLEKQRHHARIRVAVHQDLAVVLVPPPVHAQRVVVAPLDAVVCVFEMLARVLVGGGREVRVQHAEGRAPGLGVHVDEVLFVVVDDVHMCEGCDVWVERR